MAQPPRITENDRASASDDNAAFLINPGTVKSPGVHSAGNMRHARSYIVNGSKIFIFPVGTEGFRRSGTSSLSLHRYIGATSVDGVTVHYEEGHIELSGTFPGITSPDVKDDCLDILTTPPPDAGAIALWMPGVFNREQIVLPESWDFAHSADDRSHSIDYTISFVKIGESRTVSDTPGRPSPQVPGVTTLPRGTSSHVFIASERAQTLQQIAKVVYGSQDEWGRLVSLNSGAMAQWQAMNDANSFGIATYQLPTYRWPIGTPFNY
jgi:hypothetical protein